MGLMKVGSFLSAAIIAICLFTYAIATEERSMHLNPYDIGSIHDNRCEEIRHLDMIYSFAAPATKKAWAERAKYLREQILTGAGLLPTPEKTPLNVRIFGRIERDDYSIEKVYFESFPGFYVTGNLFRPIGRKGPFPAVLNTHGHWSDGRLVHREETSIPGRCINFAKQGYIAFAYDMIGFLDSKQVEHRLGQLDGEREHLWGISIGGLQLWNSIRAVDFLLSLPDVDKNRIACTGASGGGTQTFLLTAVDDRVKFSAPVNMISSTMQGGCQCENPPLIRLDTNNMEIGALAAPRPLLLVSATGDWTVKTPTVEFPAIKSVYKLLGVEDKVAYVQFDAPHNYNKDSREAVYAWFGRWILGNPDPSAFKERPFEIEKPEDMLVFAKEPRPANALDAKGIIENRIEAAKKQLQTMKPYDEESLKLFRKTFGVPFKHCLAAVTPKNAEVIAEPRGTFVFGNFKGEKLVIGRKGKGDQIPACLIHPNSSERKTCAALIIGSSKTDILINHETLVHILLDKGTTVLTIDCFNTGEAICENPNRTTKYKFFSTYNRTDTANRVQDILTALSYLQSMKGISSVSLIGVGEAGPWCMLARALAEGVQKTIIDANGFDSSNDQAFVEKLFVPCLRRAGDFQTASALICPGSLFIHNTRGFFKTDWVEDVYRAAGALSFLKIRGTRATDAEIADWVTCTQ